MSDGVENTEMETPITGEQSEENTPHSYSKCCYVVPRYMIQSKSGLIVAEETTPKVVYDDPIDAQHVTYDAEIKAEKDAESSRMREYLRGVESAQYQLLDSTLSEVCVSITY